MAQVRGATLALCVVILLVHGVSWKARATSYNVGNSAGWDISADLPSWVVGKTFDVGDVLVFQYSKYHTVDEVDEAGFNNCSAANALLSRSDGNTTVPLVARGDRYFICGKQMHCMGGMKLHVHVGPPSTHSPAPAGEAPAAGVPQASPDGTLNMPGPDDAGIPRLVLGGSHILRLGAGAVLLTWLCVAAALLV